MLIPILMDVQRISTSIQKTKQVLPSSAGLLRTWRITTKNYHHETTYKTIDRWRICSSDHVPGLHLTTALIMDAELKRELHQIKSQIATLRQTLFLSKSEQHWVTAYFIRDLTGWDLKKLRQAREQGLIQAKRVGNSVQYLIESIPSVFIINKAEKPSSDHLKKAV